MNILKLSQFKVLPKFQTQFTNTTSLLIVLKKIIRLASIIRTNGKII